MTNLSPSPVPPPTAPKRTRWGRLAAWGILLVLLAVLALSMIQKNDDAIALNKAVPDFTLKTFDGQTITLSEQLGKVVVINFWASWCAPCEQEAADLEEAWRFYKDRGDVLFMGIAWTDTEPNALEYLQKFAVSYPNGPDLQTRISQDYRITGVPETYIVDQQGKLAYRKISPFLSLAEIRAAIDPLLTP